MKTNGFLIDGVDVFVVQSKNPVTTNPKIKQLTGFDLKAISNRGQKIWPGDEPSIEMTDVFRCRFMPTSSAPLAHSRIVELLSAIEAEGLVWTHVEKLLRIDGQVRYSLLQGE